MPLIVVAARALLALVSLSFAGALPADEAGDGLSGLINYREYSQLLSSSGQPAEAQFDLLREAGFERVVFLAFGDHDGSVAGEDRLVTSRDMDYVKIPVIWERPTRQAFYHFAAVMQAQEERKTLVHCQVNFRASAFSFLYRVLYRDVPMDEAKADMNSVWVPNDTWRDFIFAILEENGRSPDCEQCLW